MRGEDGRGEDERRFQIVLIVRSDWCTGFVVCNIFLFFDGVYDDDGDENE